MQARLTTALRQAGAAAVLDLGVAKELALAEAVEEFIARYTWRHRNEGGTAAAGAAGAAAAAAATAAAAAGGGGEEDGAPWNPGPLPMLASACPGWVCYAEKTQAGSLLPHISAAKSPQAVMGALVKRWLAARRGWDLSKVYHATVMPCYDKKLEAARDDFSVPVVGGGAAGGEGGGGGGSGSGNGSSRAVPEVDCSLTTGELQQLLDGWGLGRLADVAPTELDTLFGVAGACGAEAAAAALLERQRSAPPAAWEAHYAMPATPTGEPALHASPGGSGGYFEGVLRAAAGRLLGAGALPPGAPLPVRVGRNPDMREAAVEAAAPLSAADGSGTGSGSGANAPPPPRRALRFAAAHGFRNIQSVVRKARLGRCDHDYVEAMACPSGCLNGGGQLKARSGVTAAQLLDELETLYYVAPAAGGGGGGGVSSGQNGAAAAAAAAGDAMDVDGVSGGGGGGGADGSGADDGVWRPPLSAAGRALYREWVGGAPGSAAARRLLHTRYHHRERTALGTVGDW